MTRSSQINSDITAQLAHTDSDNLQSCIIKLYMSFPLQNARLCMDCETVFDAPQCPSCSSQSFFPLSRWIRPALASDDAAAGSTAKKASLVLLGSGVAY